MEGIHIPAALLDAHYILFLPLNLHQAPATQCNILHVIRCGVPQADVSAGAHRGVPPRKAGHDPEGLL